MEATMPERDLHEEILRLEAEVEERSEAIERCRKAILLSKLAAGGGALVFGLLLLGLVRLDAIAMIGAIAAMIGGAVGFGTTTSTSQQLSAAIGAAEARRAELIGMIDLTVVGEDASRN